MASKETETDEFNRYTNVRLLFVCVYMRVAESAVDRAKEK